MVEESISYPRFFKAEELGHSLKEIAVDNIRTSTNQDVISRWFHGPHDVDLFIWLDQNRNVIKQQISFYGQVVEWNVIEGVKTGLIIEEEGSGGGRRLNASEIIQFDTQAQRAPIEQALELCQYISALEEEERKLLIKNFAAAPMRQPLSNEEFIERFGSFLERPKSRIKNAWLGRILRYISGWFK